jgi:hypothetical protein
VGIVRAAKWCAAQAHAAVERAAMAVAKKGAPVGVVACPVVACPWTNGLGPISGDTWCGHAFRAAAKGSTIGEASTGWAPARCFIRTALSGRGALGARDTGGSGHSMAVVGGVSVVVDSLAQKDGPALPRVWRRAAAVGQKRTLLHA